MGNLYPAGQNVDTIFTRLVGVDKGNDTVIVFNSCGSTLVIFAVRFV